MKREILSYAEVRTSAGFYEQPAATLTTIRNASGLRIMKQLAGHDLRIKITLPNQEN